MNRYDSMPLNTDLARVTGILVAGTSAADLIGMGTGFIVAPYLALTARHVIDEIFKKFTHCLPTEATGDVEFGLEFAHVDPDVGTLKWDVRHYGYSPSIDVAALIMEPKTALPSEYKWCRAQISLLPPAVGDEVTAFGYPKSEHHVDDRENARILLDPRISTGKVLEIHRDYRDKILLPFPCLRTDARFDGGMSGAPVFDSRGTVFGLVSSSMPPSNPGEEHSSYVSLLWPALGLEIPFDISTNRDWPVPYPLQRLVDGGYVDVLKDNSVHIESDGRSNRVIVNPLNPSTGS